MKRLIPTRLIAVGAVFVIGNVAVPAVEAADQVYGAPLDHVVIHQRSISKDTPIRIRPFSAQDAEMGHVKKASHREQAEQMQREAPSLLLSELESGLRAAGFKDVAVAKKGDTLPPSCYVIDGKFTVLHPGSQQERLWIGLGAGKSKTCFAGKVTDQGGKDLADFENCRVGVWWGSSKSEMRDDSGETGNQITGFMHHWAEGDYTD